MKPKPSLSAFKISPTCEYRQQTINNYSSPLAVLAKKDRQPFSLSLKRAGEQLHLNWLYVCVFTVMNKSSIASYSIHENDIPHA